MMIPLDNASAKGKIKGIMGTIHLIQSNSLDVLCERFAANISDKRGEDPFLQENIVTQTEGMKRWLMIETAAKNRIAANFCFFSPDEFFVELFYRFFHTQDAIRYNPRSLCWKIFKLLRESDMDIPELLPVRNYFQEDDLKMYQLCRKVSDLFDQYMVYRPDVIREWEKGKTVYGTVHEKWQMVLWRMLAENQVPNHITRSCMKEKLLHTIRMCSAEEIRAIFPRLSVFGLAMLPRYYMDILSAAADKIPVFIYFMNPCREYWSDLISDRAASRQAVQEMEMHTDASDLHLDAPNSLLGNLGKTGRDFFDMVYETDPIEESRVSDFHLPSPDSLLSIVQADILQCAERPQNRFAFSDTDRSLRIACCHSRKREVEILHDTILDMFERLNGLTPRDILVTAPDIEEYFPYIEDVFTRHRREDSSDLPFIPYAVSDRPYTGEDRAAETLIRILELPRGRAEAETILMIFESPAIRNRFHVSEDAFETIKELITGSMIKWGIDQKHRKDMGLPEYNENTWDFGLRRILAGYAFSADDARLFHRISPMPGVEGGITEPLGRFMTFVNILFDFQQSVTGRKTTAQWLKMIFSLIEKVFTEPDRDEGRETVMLADLLAGVSAECEEAGFDVPVSYDVIHDVLQTRLSRQRSSRLFLRRGITFSSIKPMRSIPFQVICMLGMNSDYFPRKTRKSEFDLIQAYPRKGDRNPRENELYLFLETILSAQKELHISFCGRSIQDNSPRLISPPVRELLDYVDRNTEYTPDPQQKVSDVIQTEHPLQPFSQRYLDKEEPRIFTYSPVPEIRRTSGSPTSIYPPLPEDHGIFPEIFSLGEFISFFQNPCAYFFQHRLNVRLDIRDARLPEPEMFAATGLDHYKLGRDRIESLLCGKDEHTPFVQAGAKGELPYGSMKDTTWQKIRIETDPMTKALLSRIKHHPADVLEGMVCAGPFRIHFNETCHARELMYYHPAKIRGKYVLKAWITHLIADRIQPDIQTLFFFKDAIVRFDDIPGSSEETLADLADILALGMRKPIAFFCESAYQYVSTLLSPKGNEKKALTEARSQYESGYFSSGEGSDIYIKTAFYGQDPLAEPFFSEFRELATRIFSPALENMKEEK